MGGSSSSSWSRSSRSREHESVRRANLSRQPLSRIDEDAQPLTPRQPAVPKKPIPKAAGTGPVADSFEHPIILQFTCGIYFVEEAEGKIDIDIMRLGEQSGRAFCKWTTEDGSGHADDRYEAVEGELEFRDGEHKKTISVNIIDSDQWAATLEFKVVLSEPEGCTLGAYLHTCRVKVIDKDHFPSSRFPEVCQGIDAIKTIGPLALFSEYCKMNFGVNGIAWRTVTCLLFDQMKNVYLFFKLRWMAYMLNEIFHDVDKHPSFTIDERVAAAKWVAMGYVLPMFVLHAWDLIRVRIDISGHSRCFLQQNLVRKYLNYNEESRSEIGVTDMQLAVREDSHELAEGYMAVLAILRLVGKLMVILYFILHENPKALKFVIIMPCLMLVFGFFRNSSLFEASKKSDDLGGHMIAYVGDAANNYELIADYFQRPKINDEFASFSSAWREAKVSPNSVRVNNDYFTQWLGPIFIGFYIIEHARSLLTGALGHGTFVATLSVLGEISGDFGEGYRELMKISSIAGCLQGVTEMLNLKTDLMDWKRVNRKRRLAGKAARDEVLQRADKSHPFPSDLVDLKIKNVCYFFNTDGWALKGVNLSVSQGVVVAIRGIHQQGRQTFLRLIAHKLFPKEGEIVIPTHLRILHVSLEPFILNMSLLNNLAFGVQAHDIDMDRITTVLKMLGEGNLVAELGKDENLPAQETSDSDSEDQQACVRCCVEHPEPEAPSVGWMKKLTYTDKVKLHLARAFIMDPEVMVIQRPFLHFNLAECGQIVDLIHEHVRNRGLGLPPETAFMRRPRTVFMSVENEEQAKDADVVWKFENIGTTNNVKATTVVCERGDKEPQDDPNLGSFRIGLEGV